MFVTAGRDVDAPARPAAAGADGAEVLDAAESYLRTWDDRRSFWAEMPDRQWSLEWVGWPKDKPRHARRHRRWHLALTLGLCAAFAACLLYIPLK